MCDKVASLYRGSGTRYRYVLPVQYSSTYRYEDVPLLFLDFVMTGDGRWCDAWCMVHGAWCDDEAFGEKLTSRRREWEENEGEKEAREGDTMKMNNNLTRTTTTDLSLSLSSPAHHCSFFLHPLVDFLCWHSGT